MECWDPSLGFGRYIISNAVYGLSVGLIERSIQRSYAADYIGLSMLLMAYLLVRLLSLESINNVEVTSDDILQVATIAEPFHRMFSLDDRALQYPHAEAERVPVSTDPLIPITP